MKTAMRMGCTKHSRPRTLSCSVLPPKDELLRESIRHQVASEPYVNMTKEKTWEEANRLASSLEKKAVVVRKAIYNRRQFVNKKISDALVKFEVVDPRSPAIYEIAEIAQVCEEKMFSNHFSADNRYKRCPLPGDTSPEDIGANQGEGGSSNCLKTRNE
uniref:Aldedh domain-containing protein n=1 Tax=Caenorhabditis tropicalis TaxID=1561998 RepID=A0A1I7THM6_9PELO